MTTQRQGKSMNYVLITPARNEEAVIRHTLESMIVADASSTPMGDR